MRQRPGVTGVRAVGFGLLIGLPAASVWPLLLAKLGAIAASIVEVVFLAIYVWWASGGGPPARIRAARAFTIECAVFIVVLTALATAMLRLQSSPYALASAVRR